MKASEIDYGTEIVRPYLEAIAACSSCSALLTELRTNWAELAPDAIVQAERLKLDDATWLWVLKHKMRQGYAARVLELAGAIVMPALLLEISFAALTYCVPQGCAYIRLMEDRALDMG